MPIGVPTGNEGQWTFLEICQRTVRECRLKSGATLMPRTVLNQTGEMLRIVDWVAEAWFDIQSLHPDWKFKRRQTTFETVDGQSEYTPEECQVDAGTFNRWYLDTFRSYKTSVGLRGEIRMSKLGYDAWRNSYQLGALRFTKSQPLIVSWLPTNGLGLGPVPLAGYSILGHYATSPIRMEVDEDVPELPSAYSAMIIVYKAMIEFGLSQPAPEVLTRGEEGYGRLLSALEANQLPAITLCGALA